MFIRNNKAIFIRLALRLAAKTLWLRQGLLLQRDWVRSYPLAHFPGNCLLNPDRHKLGFTPILKLNVLSSTPLLTTNKSKYNKFIVMLV